MLHVFEIDAKFEMDHKSAIRILSFKNSMKSARF